MTPIKGGFRGGSYTYGSRITNFCPKMFGKSAEALKRLKKHFWNIQMIFRRFWTAKSIFEKKLSAKNSPFLAKIAVWQYLLENRTCTHHWSLNHHICSSRHCERMILEIWHHYDPNDIFETFGQHVLTNCWPRLPLIQ